MTEQKKHDWSLWPIVVCIRCGVQWEVLPTCPGPHVFIDCPVDHEFADQTWGCKRCSGVGKVAACDSTWCRHGVCPGERTYNGSNKNKI